MNLGLNKINIQEVCEEPEEVSKFKYCTGESCYTMASPYPIKAWMIDYMKTAIVNSNVKLFQQIPTDIKNDVSNQQNNVKL